jgi:hypothetical protein
MRSIRWTRGLARARRGGMLLDAVLGFGVIVVGAFLLYHAGLTFHQLLNGAERFFGT